MKIKVLVIGKTDDKNLQLLIDKYEKRLKHYVKFQMEIIPDLKKTKNLSEKEQKEKEGELLLKKIGPMDQLWLLDEKGEIFRSLEFSTFIQMKMNAGIKQLIFAVGGPYGFSADVYQKAVGQISLSKMTFSHQMIRLFLTEQIYRAFTILKNEPYHHE
jgi:23S rRNA (pseudouridine1915-N3)-methyltransferase